MATTKRKRAKRPEPKGPVLNCVGCALCANTLADVLDAISKGAFEAELRQKAAVVLSDKQRKELGVAYVSAAKAALQFLHLIQNEALLIAEEYEPEVRMAQDGALVALQQIAAMEKPNDRTDG